MATCKIDGCPRPAKSRGWCQTHYMRWVRRGVAGPAESTRPRGEAHHRWATDSLTYSGAHIRVRRARGKASTHSCVDCSGPASSWAYDHKDSEQLVDTRGRAYSGNPEHYEPKCVPCHKSADLRRLAVAA